MDVGPGDQVILKSVGYCVIDKLLPSGAAWATDFDGRVWLVTADDIAEAEKQVLLF